MKELTTEQKAKAYDEALERAKKELSNNLDSAYKNYREHLENIFPELAGSEEEKIKKELIDFVKSRLAGFPQCEKFIAWLEKQGDLNPYSGVSFKYNGHIWGMCARDNGVEILVDGEIKERVFIKEEKVDNNTNKIEPKFKVGDWVVTPENKVFHITNIKGTSYVLNNESHDWEICYWEICYCDEKCHLWTIDDAKNGDVLVCPLQKGCENGEQIFIFKGINSRDYVDNCIEYYCRICQDVFYENENGYMGTTSSPLHPSTKEQRDLLFAKMKEAGYEWSDKDRKLIKIVK